MLRQLHPLWSALPAGLRRWMYERATILAAPPAPPLAAGSGEWQPPFVVVGPLSAPTGLGASARLLLEGLLALKLPTSLIDLSAALMQPTGVPLPALPAPTAGPGTLVLAVQPPNVGHALTRVGRGVLAGKRRVGYWMWELETVPAPWRRSLPLVHEIAAPSAFAGRALARSLGVPVRLLPFAFAPSPDRRRRPPGAAPLTFGAGFDLGSTAARKNPFGPVLAFRQAFESGDPVRLLLRVRGEKADPKMFQALADASEAPGARIEIVANELSEAGLSRWWDEIDVLVSLHRSEGFGLYLAEAMLQGIPVIATDWSATSEFVTERCGWPISARMIPAVDETGRYQLPGARWADPDLAQAAHAMRAAVQEGPDGLARRGLDARTAMAERFSLERFRERLFGEAEMIT